MQPSVNSSAITSSDSQEFFVPVPAKRRKTRKEGQFHDLMEMMKTVVQQDPLSDFLNFAREEAEKSRQHLVCQAYPPAHLSSTYPCVHSFMIYTTANTYRVSIHGSVCSILAHLYGYTVL